LTGRDKVRIEEGQLIVSPLEAEERPASSEELEEMIVERLPRIDLPALLIEVDRWVGFSEAFTHAGGSSSRKPDLPIIYAALLAQSGNFGLTQMARMSGFGYQQLLWTTSWYLREETLREAVAKLVNHHFHLPLSQILGGGMLSSSDGQRFPAAVKTGNATALPKYFGYGCGLTFYTWTSDQYSQFGTKVILKGKLRQETFLNRWDDLLRVAGALKLGWVTASLLISKLHAMPKQNSLVKSLQEYGRLVKTNFILRYLGSEEFRRQINRQLNKGEALHSLRRFLFVANEAQIRKRHLDDQLNQAACLNLVTNAVVVWNTIYMWEVVEHRLHRRLARDFAASGIAGGPLVSRTTRRPFARPNGRD
jgi:TnpA family transposase